MSQNPVVFMSYTHESKEHMEKVLALSDRLRSEGIDVVLDQYEPTPAQGWPRWIDQNIRDADFVLMVCTENYSKRVMGEEKEGVGLGVKWEGNLIYQHLYNSDSQSKKFIPILMSGKDHTSIPTPVQGFTHYNVGDDEKYDALYWMLRGINPTEKPELGKLRPLPKREPNSLFIGGFIDIDLWNKAQWSGTAYLEDARLKEPPIMCLIFRDAQSAKMIMKGWLLRLGETDKYNELRVSIIEGDIPGEESGYSIHINSNILNIISKAKAEGVDFRHDIFIMTSRFHRMTPKPGARSLIDFREMYERFGSFSLRVGVLDSGKLRMLKGMYLHKRDIEFRNVKDITSKDDLDAVLLPEYRDEDFQT